MTARNTPGDVDFAEALDHVLRAWSRGLTIDAGDLCAMWPALRNQAVQVLEIAREVAIVSPPVLPDVPGYRLLDEIGRGGMGIVYRAHQAGTERIVALKVLPSPDDARARSRFLAEARALGGVRHPHVVSIYDVIVRTDLCAFAMEWIDGQTLAARIERRCDSAERAPAEVSWICKTGIAVARALSAVHQAGLLHRDVKPSNVLLRADGSPLLSDFGLVHDRSLSLTQAGQVLGTPVFAAPEQLRGDIESLDARTDIYGLGATLHTSLAAEVPFPGAAAPKLLAAILAGRRKPLTELGVPRDLETIIAKCLEPEQKDRYASVDEVAAELQRVLELRPIMARPLSVSVRATRLLRRNSLLVAVALVAAAIALLVGGIAVSAWFESSQWDKRIAAELRDARLFLLEPTHGERVTLANRGQGVTRASSFAAAPNPAIDAYEALADQATEKREIVAERDVIVCAAALLASRRPEVGLALSELAPGTAAAARTWSEEPMATPELPTDGRDRRLLGLLAFLTDRVDTCRRAWAEFELRDDPFVDAAAAQLHIEHGEYAIAYPRIALAARAWPSVGFLAVKLADCAVQLKDLEVAGRELQRAGPLSKHDPFDTLVRVRADWHAACGRDNEAIADYSWLLERHRSVTARQHYAALCERRGDWARACELWLWLVEHEPDGRRYVEHALAAWLRHWHQLGIRERVDVVCQVWSPTRRNVDTRVAAVWREFGTFATGTAADEGVHLSSQDANPEVLMLIEEARVHALHMPMNWRRLLAYLPSLMPSSPELFEGKPVVPSVVRAILRGGAGVGAALWSLCVMVPSQSCPSLGGRIQITSNGFEEQGPTMSFSLVAGPGSAARGLLVWTHVISRATVCQDTAMAASQYGPTPLGVVEWSAAQQPTQNAARHSLFTLDFAPNGADALIAFNTSPVGVSQCIDELGSRLWNGTSFSTEAISLDGDDDDWSGTFRFHPSGTYGLQVWRNSSLSAGLNYSHEAREWNAATSSFSSSHVINPTNSALTHQPNQCLALHQPSDTWVTAYVRGVGTSRQVCYHSGQRSTGGTWTWSAAQTVPSQIGGDGAIPSFHTSGEGLLAWTDTAINYGAGPIIAAQWDATTATFGTPATLTSNTTDRLQTVIAEPTGWHLLFTRIGTGGVNQIHYGFYDGTSLLGLTELTTGIDPKSEVSAARDHAGTIHVTWIEGAAANTEVWVGQLATNQCTAYGAGCAGTGGLSPLISAAGSPTIGTTAFAFTLSQAPPFALAVPFVGLDDINVAFGSCDVLVASPLSLSTITTDSSGRGAVPLAIPLNSALVGSNIYCQYLVVDPAGPFFGFSTLSGGLAATIR